MTLGLAGLVPLAVTMSGTVTDDHGAPIRRAFVRVGQGRELGAAYTGEDGTYQMRFWARTDAPADVSVGADGYEANVRELRVSSTDPRHDARLRPLVHIDAGAAADLVVAADDGLCHPVRTDAVEVDRSWPCRLVRVAAREAGVLNVVVVSADPHKRLGVTFAVGSQPTVVFAAACCAPVAAARLPAGAEAMVQVVALDLDRTDAAQRGRATQSFTISTALDPP